MSKLFTVAGTSKLEGILKFRVANGGAAARTRVLEENGHTEINLQDLPKAMSKEDAMAFLGYTEGKASAPKAEKAPVAPKAEKVIEKEFKIPRKVAPAITTKNGKTLEEIEAIRAKNLETMRKVSAKNRKRDEALAEEKADEDWLNDFNYVGSRHHY